MDPITVQYYANIATIVGVLGIIGLFFQFDYQRKRHKKEGAILYFEKYSDKELAECGQKAMEFLVNKDNIKNKTQAYQDHKQDAELFGSIRIYLNYFESLAYLYINNIVDRDMIINMLGGVSLRMHDIATWYIDMVQDEFGIIETNADIVGLPYTEWGKMNKMILESNDNKFVLPGRPAP